MNVRKKHHYGVYKERVGRNKDKRARKVMVKEIAGKAKKCCVGES